jgi:hypothetical protein
MDEHFSGHYARGSASLAFVEVTVNGSGDLICAGIRDEL